MLALIAVLACSSPAPPDGGQPPGEDAPPAGRIGGEPILAKPAVVGAITAEAVERGVGAIRADLDACWTSRAEGRSGKVLLRLVIAADGSVESATTQSTTLREPAVEECLTARAAAARFDALAAGDRAVVLYPLEVGA
jgi:hypothetical protein